MKWFILNLNVCKLVMIFLKEKLNINNIKNVWIKTIDLKIYVIKFVVLN